MAEQRRQIHPLLGRDVRLELQAGEREKIVNKAAHAGGLIQHDGEEAFLRLRVGLCRTLQGFDETAQRGERRETGRASCRERVCKSVYISGVACPYKKKK